MQASPQLEREFLPDPIGKPMAGAVVLHALLVGCVLGWAMINGLFHHDSWGGATEGAIAVQLVSNALPLPSDQKPNDNVLATEKPSEAPAPPAPKAAPVVDESAIAIPDKVKPQKLDKKKQEASKVTAPTPPTLSKAQVKQPPKPDTKAQYGEQASTHMARSIQPTVGTTVGQSTVVSGSSKGFNYGWYVANLNRKVQQNTYLAEVDPRTPAGTQANILFTVRRDGSATDIKMDRASGSPTLDRACLRAAQRVDTFGALPSPPSDGNLIVSYHCDYTGP
jgi:periplasmic protein TonB